VVRLAAAERPLIDHGNTGGPGRKKPALPVHHCE